ncbi:CheR family methyltransferase [Paenibacillus agilis]|uniref:protein-glutamate O-methyltransferase n=1 Tax=Paenibacillus agilis TaxID=3020863 RepID=A0A559IZ39_9BACL|nr:protein-glutamate O-methyltransferase CheR [Paenibacillus agilis]TVX92891.1 protein-glutamate O-methyltransferase CheR [Paenibacillus agilis]
MERPTYQDQTKADKLAALADIPTRTIVYSQEEDADYAIFIQLIKQKTGIDLSQYKEAQMRRRLTTLRVKNGHSTFEQFANAMNADKKLFYEFLDRMTINVSEFWRNPNRWEVLKDRVLPALMAESKQLRCWSAACSTGEEPYTLAMILDDKNCFKNTTLFASDIDENALQRAKDGIYIERALKDVPPAFQQKYFKPDGDMYRVHEMLKPHVQFRKQNLLLDKFETNLDLIICRNVMIYFTEEAKHELYKKFSQALRPGGILFVGSTEQIFNPAQYGLETQETFFYRKL